MGNGTITTVGVAVGVAVAVGNGGGANHGVAVGVSVGTNGVGASMCEIQSHWPSIHIHSGVGSGATCAPIDTGMRTKKAMTMAAKMAT